MRLSVCWTSREPGVWEPEVITPSDFTIFLGQIRATWRGFGSNVLHRLLLQYPRHAAAAAAIGRGPAPLPQASTFRISWSYRPTVAWACCGTALGAAAPWDMSL